MTAPKIGVRDTGARQRELLLFLQMVVPLEMQQLTTIPAEELRAMDAGATRQIAQHGDDLEFGGRHAAKTAAVLARSIACAALTVPGGITAFGGHWCSDHRACMEVAR